MRHFPANTEALVARSQTVHVLWRMRGISFVSAGRSQMSLRHPSDRLTQRPPLQPSRSSPLPSPAPSPSVQPLYFADVCAGPGGFTEYLCWRTRGTATGWGFTLRGEHDFESARGASQKLTPSCRPAATPSVASVLRIALPFPLLQIVPHSLPSPLFHNALATLGGLPGRQH